MVSAGECRVRVAVVGQCRAVVHLAVAVRRDGQRLLGDGLRDVVRDIIVVNAEGGCERCGNGGGGRIGVNTYRCSIGGDFTSSQMVACHQTCSRGSSLQIRGHKGGSIVLFAGIDVDGKSCRGDFQRTLYIVNSIVAERTRTRSGNHICAHILARLT